MCSLRDFPELRDCSITDKNASMALVIKRVKPELKGDQNPEPLFLPTSGLTTFQQILNKFVEENFWTACDEVTKYFKRNPSNLSILMYPLGVIMKFSPRASLK
ncbi:PREDICTED: uncharacterized protein LOC107172343, partial [Diuraphis noxia]|uniref:uncharacterized protein LOC107172343 n=1 Tax=Diuraphis noxia TaxID=143948 RepID=UPI0007638887